jgi:hypothetical protein
VSILPVTILVVIHRILVILFTPPITTFVNVVPGIPVILTIRRRRLFVLLLNGRLAVTSFLLGVDEGCMVLDFSELAELCFDESNPGAATAYIPRRRNRKTESFWTRVS